MASRSIRLTTIRFCPKDGVPTMILRVSTKGERVITLDGKTHILPGDDIVIEDGSGGSLTCAESWAPKILL